MNDLRDLDLSARPEAELTEEEQEELKRRLAAFATALKEQDLQRQAGRARKGGRKTARAWQPPAAAAAAKPRSR